MAISIDEVNRISKLARLTFNDAEKQKLQHELSSILAYVDQLSSVQGKVNPQIVDDPDAINLMRDDVVVEFPNPEELLAQAPSREENFVKVKSILE